MDIYNWDAPYLQQYSVYTYTVIVFMETCDLARSPTNFCSDWVAAYFKHKLIHNQ